MSDSCSENLFGPNSGWRVPRQGYREGVCGELGANEGMRTLSTRTRGDPDQYIPSVERARPKFWSEGAKAGAAVLGAVLVCRMREGSLEGSESEHTKASESLDHVLTTQVLLGRKLVKGLNVYNVAGARHGANPLWSTHSNSLILLTGRWV